MLVLCPIAKALSLTDKPCSRKNHSGEIPLIGGISIYLCLLILIYWVPIKSYWYIISATLIVICGIIDDYKHLNHKWRLGVEMIATLIMITWGGMEITNLGNLFGFGDIKLGNLSTTITIIAVVGGINAFNMVDGLDGAAGGVSLIIMSLIFALTTNISQISTICLIFISAIIAFLFFNMRIFGRKKATVFLGDSGSMLLGFTICYLVISVSQGENRVISPVTVLWIIGLPLIDAVCIMLRRIKKTEVS